MENLNNYLIIIIVLLAFYIIMMLYLKFKFKQNFSPVDSGIPAIEQSPQPTPIVFQPNVYETEDTRIDYPYLPPVSPMIRKRTIKSVIPANPDLYTSQSYTSKDTLLDTPPTQDTNQLNYSGGDTQMLSIPLQFNVPYNEQLRSNDILITPYNKVKYGNC